jgi:hypothetical protein
MWIYFLFLFVMKIHIWHNFLLVVLGFELRALHLLGRCSTSVTSPTPFCFSYFSDRVLCFLPGPTLDCNPPTYASCAAGITGMGHCTKPVCYISGKNSSHISCGLSFWNSYEIYVESSSVLHVSSSHLYCLPVIYVCCLLYNFFKSVFHFSYSLFSYV